MSWRTYGAGVERRAQLARRSSPRSKRSSACVTSPRVELVEQLAAASARTGELVAAGLDVLRAPERARQQLELQPAHRDAGLLDAPRGAAQAGARRDLELRPAARRPRPASSRTRRHSPRRRAARATHEREEGCTRSTRNRNKIIAGILRWTPRFRIATAELTRLRPAVVHGRRRARVPARAAHQRHRAPGAGPARLRRLVLGQGPAAGDVSSSCRSAQRIPAAARRAISRPPVAKRLAMFVLRSKVKLTDASDDWAQFGVWGAGAAERLAPLAPCPTRILTAHSAVRHRSAGRAQRWRCSVDGGAARLARRAQRRTEPGRSRRSAPAGRSSVLATQDQFVPQMVNLERARRAWISRRAAIRGRRSSRARSTAAWSSAAWCALRGGALRAGQDLYADDPPGQTSGTVVNAAPAPEGGSESRRGADQLAGGASAPISGAPDWPRRSSSCPCPTRRDELLRLLPRRRRTGLPALA